MVKQKKIGDLNQVSIKVFENYLVDKEPVEGEGLFVDDVFHADVTSATSGSGISA